MNRTQKHMAVNGHLFYASYDFLQPRRSYDQGRILL